MTTSPDEFVRRYAPLSTVIDTLVRRELALLDPTSWPDRNDGHFMELFKRQKEVKGLYALCAANGPETFHHWGVFAKGSDGACLEIKKGPLEAALYPTANVRYGRMDYLLLAEVEDLNKDDIDRLPFCKRAGYIDEEEYRIIAWNDEKQAGKLSLPLRLDWINRVVLSPMMPRDVGESVKTLLKSIKDCQQLHVVHSQLTDSKRWKEAGDRVVGLKPRKGAVKIELKAPAPKGRSSKARKR